jgi:NTP pyrophosphatase (non-canonical NTP hydrolase)
VTALDEVLREVAAERRRQDEKWGEQNHDPLAWCAILIEEVGEAAREALNATVFGGDPSVDERIAADLRELRTELIQCAAVGVAAVESLDRARARRPWAEE